MYFHCTAQAIFHAQVYWGEFGKNPFGQNNAMEGYSVDELREIRSLALGVSRGNLDWLDHRERDEAKGFRVSFFRSEGTCDEPRDEAKGS